MNNKGGEAEDEREANWIPMHTFPSAHVEQMELQAPTAWLQMAALPLTQKETPAFKMLLAVECGSTTTLAVVGTSTGAAALTAA